MVSNPCSTSSNDVVLEDFSFLVKRQTDSLQKLQTDLEELDKRRNEYTSVKDKLKEVSSKLTYPTMVPLSKVAFMPGELIHTNEVLVLLGDGYFVETTAPKASDIADKRLNLIAERRKELEEAVKRQKNEVESTKKFVDENNSGPVREVFEQLADDDSVAVRDGNANRVSKVKNDDDKGAVLASLKEKQERIRKGVKQFEEGQSSSPSQKKNAEIKVEVTKSAQIKESSQIKECTDEPEVEQSRNSTSNVMTTLGSSIDKEAILKRVEKLMRESKELDELDREESEDSDDTQAQEKEDYRDNVGAIGATNEADHCAKEAFVTDTKCSDNRRVSFSKEIAIREISPTGKQCDVKTEQSTSTSENDLNNTQLKSWEPSTAVEETIVERSATLRESASLQNTQNMNVASTKPVSLFKKSRKR
ncbi:uncharacterized protein LOC142350023 [Convolutriloba macropyga]|uniref:uncharacterized protein LOC142350023 n=1 Tax=Convolutriloba macropyga TaxID=536237 RepID=UPI003F51C3C9